ncbi:MAG: Hsp33 family molecular chaperone HslO [Myxococcales bacterium]|nr:Hsp33 family molecular chaperone HslO [Myxococcales bacterium]
MDTHDSVVRAITNDGGFRVMTALCTETAQEALRCQGGTGTNATLLANLITGAILVRETMAPAYRVQVNLAGKSRRGQIVAESNPDGTARGLIRTNEDEPLELGTGAMLQVMRALPGVPPQRGIIEIPKGATVSEMLTVYMKSSEQIDTMVSVGSKIEGDQVVYAGGYVVQLLPELEEGPLIVMRERLKDFRDVAQLLDGAAASPKKLTEELLYAMDYTLLDESALSFGCACSRVRVMASLASLPREDVEDLLKSGENLSMSCDYCGREYLVQPEELKGLRDPT